MNKELNPIDRSENRLPSSEEVADIVIEPNEDPFNYPFKNRPPTDEEVERSLDEAMEKIENKDAEQMEGIREVIELIFGSKTRLKIWTTPEEEQPPHFDRKNNLINVNGETDATELAHEYAHSLVSPPNDDSERDKNEIATWKKAFEMFGNRKWFDLRAHNDYLEHYSK